MEDFVIEVNQDCFSKIVAKKQTAIVLLDSGKNKKFAKDNLVFFKNGAEVANAKVTNILHFNSVIEALKMVKPQSIGYSSKTALTKIEDSILFSLGRSDSCGVIVLEFQLIN